MNPRAGQALYMQLVQQVRHAVETGVLHPGDQLPGIRTLAQEIVVSHATVVKAYSLLEQEGLIEVRHGSGAYIAAQRRRKSRSDAIRLGQERVRELVRDLEGEGLTSEEIRRVFEAELLYPDRPMTAR